MLYLTGDTHGDWVEKKPFTTLFLDGNHENYDILDAYRVKKAGKYKRTYEKRR